MASDQEIQTYLALWFQLGKAVVNQSTGARLHPGSVSHDDTHSAEFAECWRVISQHANVYYLEGTEQSIEELRSPSWEFIHCARCVMPVPMRLDSAAFGPCPCQDLPLWPNVELPLPRLPISNRKVLNDICHRLTTKTKQPATSESGDIQPLETSSETSATTTMPPLTASLAPQQLHPDQEHERNQVWEPHRAQEPDLKSDLEPDLALDDTLSPADCAIALSIHSEHHRPGSPLAHYHSPAPNQDTLGQQRQESLYQAQCQYHHHSPHPAETEPQDFSTDNPAIAADPTQDHTWSIAPAVSPAPPSQPPYTPVYPHCQVPPSHPHTP
jgi:hypothetical protein